MMATCPICGTRRVIYWPKHWVYRRGETYYCSEDCMMVDETKDMKLIKMIAHVRAQKGSKMVKKIGDEQKAQAVRIALGGGNPLPYLKQCGSKNPSASWAYIKNCLAKKDPETFAKIETEQPAQAPVVKLSGPLKIETPEAAKVEVVETPEKTRHTGKSEKPRKITEPVVYDGFIVREVEGMFGRYRRSDIGCATYIDFESAEGMDTLSMTVDQWRSFRDENAKAAKVLGVEL